MSVSDHPVPSLTAAKIMSRAVVMIPEQMSLSAAAHLLSQHHISGAPVVDGDGHCVGVLSSTDFVHFVEKGESLVTGPHLRRPCVCSDWQVVDPEILPVDEVSKYMTPDPVTTGPGARLGELAQKMLDAHSHRIVVVDNQHRPMGIVSSTDILAAVAHGEVLVAATAQ
jgi:CBS-domain-containing membrane protein